LQISQHLIRYLLSFALFLVVKHSASDEFHKKKSSHTKERSAGKTADSKQKKTVKKTTASSSSSHAVKQKAKSGPKANAGSKAKLHLEQTRGGAAAAETIKKSGRPEDEVVSYEEINFELKEVTPNGTVVVIGPPGLTRFEKARITGARSLQLSLGAPSLIEIPVEVRDSVSLAIAEIEAKALPISIRRVLPNGLYQDIPISWMN
jgi:DNA-directed RNA polymerase I, II, and III subunit RPABC2